MGDQRPLHLKWRVWSGTDQINNDKAVDCGQGSKTGETEKEKRRRNKTLTTDEED